MSYVVCTMHEEMRSAGFLVDPQNQGQRFISDLASKSLGWFVSGLASKPLGRFISGLASKPIGWFILFWPQNQWLQVSRFEPQNWQLQFGDLGIKITAMIFWFRPQNKVGYGLSVMPQNR
jgi:hypothetical protein